MKLAPSREIEDILALTPLQKGILFNCISNPDSQLYYQQLSLQLIGTLDVNMFTAAWNMVVQRNEMLRTIFRWENIKEPVQIILKHMQVPVKVYEYSAVEAETRNSLVNDLKTKDRRELIDLQKEPLRLKLIRLAKDTYEVLLTYHHILFDGWSNVILIDDLFTAYESLAGYSEYSNNKSSFKDYVKASKQSNTAEQREYWRAHLIDLQEQVLLFPDKDSRRQEHNLNLKHTHVVSTEIKEKMESVCRNLELTAASFLYSAWAIVISKYKNTDSVIFGTTISDRPVSIPRVEQMIGLFINTVPMQINLIEELTVQELLLKVKGELIERRQYHNTPLIDIKQFCNATVPGELFDTNIIIENYPIDYINKKTYNLPFRLGNYSMFEGSDFDITLQVVLTDVIELHFLGGPKTQVTAEALSGLAMQFENTLRQMAADPNEWVESIDILTTAERHKLIHDFNQTDNGDGENTSFLSLLQDSVKQYPNSIAVEQGENRYTYEYIDKKSNQAARLLRRHGIGANQVVGLLVGRKPELLIALLGILKAGGSYLPLDPQYPKERITSILEDSGTKLIITDKSGYEDVCSKFDTISMEELVQSSEDDSVLTHGHPLPSDMMYLIYTSGSTGTPKGVMIQHKAFYNFIEGMLQRIPMDETSVVAAVTTISFDIFALEGLLPLAVGAKIVLASEVEQTDMERLGQMITEKKIDFLQSTPSRLRLLLNKNAGKESLNAIKHLLIGGEPLHEPLLEELKNSMKGEIYNMYGPTETTIWSTVKRLTDSAELSIGTPIRNTQIYILNHKFQPQPIGVAGELYISGEGLSQGYFNRPDLTKERFIEHPFKENCRMYKTGDAARWLPNGSVEILGRLDNQIKIRGFRVELEEIERFIARFGGVKEAVVIAKKNKHGEDNLHAFFTSDQPLDTTGLRNYLVSFLPVYMIPSTLVQLNDIPKTPNGKINRQGLFQITRPEEKRIERSAPKSSYEQKVMELWREELECSEINTQHNFFDLGGNSFSVMRIMNRINQEYQLNLPVTTLFQYPTIEALSSHLSGLTMAESDVRLPVHKMGPHHETDIAIIGISGIFPGAGDLDTFWSNLVNGVDSISVFPKEPGSAARTYSSGVISDIDMFDAGFFGYTPMEAQLMDPQHRIFLECAYHALENAGYHSEMYSGEIGVFATTGMNTYLLNSSQAWGIAKKHGVLQTMLMNDKDFLSTKLSYKLNLSGPSINIQTACSSSLVCVHEACLSLINDECSMALAGGVAVKIPQDEIVYHDEGGVISKDGQCRAFDERANGTVSGNGAGVVVLKRLEDALHDHDHIYAVIKGSAINNDGAEKIGYTAPSVNRQSKVIDKAIARAGVDPQSIQYVEAHGTGTILGDPIEVAALTQTYRNYTNEIQYCAIGSVKTNIGHLDAAAGIAGLIKTTLMLKNAMLVPSLHYQSANPNIDFQTSPFYVIDQAKPWNVHEGPRRAAVSSFGIGGTNAHLILEEAPAVHSSKESRRYLPVILSAQKWESLTDTVEGVIGHLRNHAELSLADVAYTLAVGRKRFKESYMLVCSDVNELIEVLETKDPLELHYLKRADTQHGVAFMFPGLGEHYTGMGQDLYENELVFREAVDRCAKIIMQHARFDIRDIMFRRQADEWSTCQIHLSLFVLEYAISVLYIHWGVVPKAMIGYSIGEYVAACLSEVITLQDALFLIMKRGQIIDRVTEKGGMLAVCMGVEETLPILTLTPGLSVAAVNSPSITVVAGSLDELDILKVSLQQQGVAYQAIKGSKAFHSHMMKSAREQFLELLQSIPLKKPTIPYISNVTGHWMKDEDAADPEYWIRHMCETVNFSKGIQSLLREGLGVALEVGPGRFLSSLIQQNVEEPSADVPCIASMGHVVRGYSEHYSLIKSAGMLAGMHVPFNWERFYQNEERRRVPLVPYPFFKQRYWLPQDTLSRREGDESQSLYSLTWKRASLGGLRVKQNTRRVCIFGYPSELIDSIQRQLVDEGNEVYCIFPAEDFSEADGIYYINSTRMNDYISIMDRIGSLPDEILYMWGLNEEEAVVEQSLSILERLFREVLVNEILRIYLIGSRLFHVIGNEPTRTDASIYNKCCLTLNNISKNLRCKLIDMEIEQQYQQCAAQLLMELEQGQDSTIAVYRNGYRWVIEWTEENSVCSSSAGDEAMSLFIMGDIKQREAEMIALLTEMGCRIAAVADSSSGEYRSLDGVRWEQIQRNDEEHTLRIYRDACESEFGVNGIICFSDSSEGSAPDLRWTDKDYGMKPMLHLHLHLFDKDISSGLPAWLLLNNCSYASRPYQTAAWEWGSDKRQTLNILRSILSMSDGAYLITAQDKVSWMNVHLNTSGTDVPNITTLYQRPELSVRYAPPSNNLEKAISELWQDIFGVENIGMYDDFFDLGGNSLVGISLINAINNKFHLELKVQDVFLYPTIHHISGKIIEFFGDLDTVDEFLEELSKWEEQYQGML